jgi:hypothetical protein
LKQQGYTLQRTQKTLEGAQHPDRDGQFRYVNEQARSHLADGQPVVSVDTKKKELVGRYANGGAEWQPAGWPERVGVHDFPGPKVGKAIPTGSMTWAPTPAGSAWEPTMTRRRLRWRRSSTVCTVCTSKERSIGWTDDLVETPREASRHWVAICGLASLTAHYGWGGVW